MEENRNAAWTEGPSAGAKHRRRRHRPDMGRESALASPAPQTPRTQGGKGGRALKETARPQPAKAAPSAPRAKQVRPVRGEEDPGLLLISRRPPAQKFSSFEEYMKGHGGFSAPEDGQEK